MKTFFWNTAAGFAGLGMLATILMAGDPGRQEPVDITGFAEFEAPTNVMAVSVKGKSTSIAGHATVFREQDGIVLERLEATAPVKSFSTGMAVRDEHMRTQVFTTAGGETPDLRFAAEKSECARAAGQDFNCEVSGMLSVRGLERPFHMNLKLKQAGSAYKASGEAIVKLADYQIPQPTQFGVKIASEIKLRLELTARSGR